MTANQLIVQMVFDRWYSLLKLCQACLDAIPDERLAADIVPGKNRGIYILGHLIGVHDAMLPILGLGTQKHKDLYETFVAAPDKAVAVIPSAAELRIIWKKQTEYLVTNLESLSADEWFKKHELVSAEDFEKEPYRNKLNVLLTRTTHLSYHVGQLILLK